MSQPATHAVLPGRPTIRSQVVGLAWPVMAEMFLQTFTQIVSMALVGHLGASAVASIGLSMQPLNVYHGVFTGISVGATAVVSRLCGAGDHRRAATAFAQSVAVSALIAVLGAVLLFIWTRPIVIWMGAEPEVVGPSTQYLRIMIPGLVFMWISTVLNGALRGAGDVRTPMRINIIINLMNFAGNLLLVYGLFGFPALGVYGAGLATTIARVAGGLLLFIPYILGRSSLQVGARDFRLDRSLIARISRTGIPGALERLAISSASCHPCHRHQRRIYILHARYGVRDGRHHSRRPEPRRGTAGRRREQRL